VRIKVKTSMYLSAPSSTSTCLSDRILHLGVLGGIGRAEKESSKDRGSPGRLLEGGGPVWALDKRKYRAGRG
jgi:hypothetical protein